MSGVIADGCGLRKSGGQRRYSVSACPVTAELTKRSSQKRKISEPGSYLHETYFSTKILTKPITSLQGATGLQFNSRKKHDSCPIPEEVKTKPLTGRKSQSFTVSANGSSNEFIKKRISDDDDDDSNDDEVLVEPVACGHPHDRKLMLRQDIAAPIEVVHNLLFTSSKWFYEFHVEREHTETFIGEWEIDDEGNTRRHLTYTVPVKNSPLSNFAICTEKQVMEEATKPGQISVCHIEITNSGIPYQDTFYVDLHICLTKTGSSRCTIYVDLEVKYRKAVWGMIKGFIERNVYSATLIHYEQLGRKLDATAAHSISTADQVSEQIERTLDTSAARSISTANQTNGPKRREIPRKTMKTQITISREPPKTFIVPEATSKSWKLWLWPAVVLLLLFNLGLHWKLSSLEGLASSNYVQRETFRKWSGNQVDVERLLEELDRNEINSWKNMLTTALDYWKRTEAKLEKINQLINDYERQRASVASTLTERLQQLRSQHDHYLDEQHEREEMEIQLRIQQQTSLQQHNQEERRQSCSAHLDKEPSRSNVNNERPNGNNPI